ncbi:glycoside hydrolase family 3 N-terminal domain-containing protein [Paenibacillus sinopodophylli]|uniref:glycoside hydrolase family 3 N-terminal domain-containing protein n=1 Tax=Paenibacillus sinopodophylli TaxID=1837342 RepID=UPI00110CD349|nr:glycoside hydrolase family 3 N-terminal domain-containing protein [Paenibacillus sinopodophylli]
MIGIWHAFVNLNGSKIKYLFLVEKIEGYRLTINTEPMPSFILPMQATAEGNWLEATGRSSYSNDPVKVKLKFGDTQFAGTITMPFIGELQLSGGQGRGASLAEELIPKVKPYRKADVSARLDEEIRQEVDKLLARMTITDKIGQMSQIGASDFSFGADVDAEPPEQMVASGKAGSALGAFDSNRVFDLQKIAVEQSPLGIPLMFNADVIHGFQTIFPVPLAWSCSWDLEGIKQACVIAAKEAAVSGTTYNHGPMVDITRDPRWGRVVEGAGEDPYLGALIAKAQVEGYQGDSLFDRETIIACLKHFIAYGAAEGGRDYNTVDISEGTLRNVFLPPFKAGIEAGAGSVMNAFNTYQGVPVAGSEYLLKELLRNELDFDGMLISDYGAIEEIFIHGASKDSEEAAKLALDATMDMEMVTSLFAKYLPSLIEKGVVKEEQLDDAVRRILTYKYKIGIMDDPFRYVQPEKEIEYHYSKEHLEASRDLARKSIVLLKNDGILPLRNDGTKIALIGPFATSRDLVGPWQFSRYGMETVTLKEGLEGKGIDEQQLFIASGCEVNEEIDGGLHHAIEMASQADIVVLALGEDSNMSGEAASRADISLPLVQQRLAEEIVKLGKPTVLVLTNGRPLVLDWFEQHVDAIVETWFLGSQAGHAIADVLLGAYNPSGKLTMSFPRHAGQVPIYYNAFNTGRPVTPDNMHSKYISKYIDCPNEPLYPFGYGLSYTSFDYSDLRLDQATLKRSDSLNANITVTNTGKYEGEETVQLYIRDLYGSVVRPVKELKGFQKIHLQPGESQSVTFQIKEDDLKYYSKNHSFEAELGSFLLFIGPHSEDLQEVAFELVDEN